MALGLDLFNEYFDRQSGVDQLAFADLEAESRSFVMAVVPNGHIKNLSMFCIATHTAP
jgi:1,4-dihydroxy-2-naphthoate octaprenyltransferase